MKKITVYSTSYCGYCRAAKQLLANLELPYTEIDITDNDPKRRWLTQVTGHRTVPQIFIDDVPIGGYTDLSELIKSNQLMPLLEK